MHYKTEQESFWAGEFGNEYIARNNESRSVAMNIAMFSRILNATRDVESISEFGANIGINLRAFQTLNSHLDISAVEINEKAVRQLEKLNLADTFHTSILEFKPDRLRDFVLIKGVLIHIDPNELVNVYQRLYESSKKYICLAEYYSPSPVEISYRGHDGRLFKRDFCGELMDKYIDLKLVDYGFVYHRDPNFPQDDLTWFLLEKVRN